MGFAIYASMTQIICVAFVVRPIAQKELLRLEYVVFKESNTQCDTACVVGLFVLQTLAMGPVYKYRIASLRLDLF